MREIDTEVRAARKDLFRTAIRFAEAHSENSPHAVLIEVTKTLVTAARALTMAEIKATAMGAGEMIRDVIGQAIGAIGAGDEDD